MKYPLDAGVLTGPVTVGFVEKPDTVWVSLDRPREELMDKVEKANLTKLDTVDIGCVVATIFSEDGALYRANVLSISGSEVEVRYCDYGNKEKKSMKELMKLPKELADHEQLAMKIRVQGIYGVADSSKNRARVEKKLSVDGLMVTLVEDDEGLTGIFEVNGKKIKFSKNKDAETKMKSDERTVEHKDLVVHTNDKEEMAKVRIDETTFDTKNLVVQTKVNNKEETTKVMSAAARIELTDAVDQTKVMDNEEKKEKIKEALQLDKEQVSTTETPAVDVLGGDTCDGTGKKDEVFDEIINVVEVPKSTKKVFAFNELPKLKLLEGVEISGTVVYVSPLGGVWFCPQWIQTSLDTLTMQVDKAAANKELEMIDKDSLREGVLCIARCSEDGELYRARVVSIDSKVTVAFIDFGNIDVVTDIYELPVGIEMLAPASAEVVLARELPKENTQQILEHVLMEAVNLVLVLEKDDCGARVGKFYSMGKEVEWNPVVETKKIFDKDRVDEENNEDVVVEEEILLKVNQETSIDEVVMNSNVKQPVEVLPISIVEPIMPRLIRLVHCPPLELGVDTEVFVVHVESVKKVWVSRINDEVRISSLMDRLAKASEVLKPAQRMKKGAVYGTKFSEDGEMYRAVLRDKVGLGVRVQYIDFGNEELKEEWELFDIPMDIGSEPAGAIAVELSNVMDDTKENRKFVEQLLGGEGLSVTTMGGSAEFKMGGEVLVLGPAPISRQSTSVTSEEMMTIRDVKLAQPATAIENVSSVEEKMSSGDVSKVPNSAAPIGVETTPLTTAAESSTKDMNSGHGVSNTIQKVSSVAAVQLPIPTIPQPVPTRNFAKAISELQTQLHVKKDSLPAAKKSQDGKLREWNEGDSVVAKCPDGVWRKATIDMVNMSTGKARVRLEDQNAVVDMINVRSPNLPVEALNSIDQGLTTAAMNVTRQKGDGQSLEKSVAISSAVVGKVKDWMDKNSAQLKLDVMSCSQQEELDVMNCSQQEEVLSSPPLDVTSKKSFELIPLPQELSSYCRTSKGSLHIQSVLSTDNVELSLHVLSSILTNDQSSISLMTSSKSSYVIQKLITVLPCTNLQPIFAIVQANFTHLSLDSAGCRVVQTLLEFCSPEQQRSLTNLLCAGKTLLTLATDRNGTYVAQACLSHLTPHTTDLLSLVNAVLGNTVKLGQHQCGTFFLQRLVGILSTHYPGSAVTSFLQEDILANIAQVVTTEPGSRLVQALLKDSQPAVVIRIAKWIQENKKVVIVTKPTIYVAIAALDLIVDRLEDDAVWRTLLDGVYYSFLDLDKDSAARRSFFMTAALHPVGNLLARDLVSKVRHVGESCKNDVMRMLAINVDVLSLDQFGGFVLKGLVGSFD